MRDLLSVRRTIKANNMISPLVGAAFSSNWKLFWKVYDKFKLKHGDWWYTSVSSSVSQN